MIWSNYSLKIPKFDAEKSVHELEGAAPRTLEYQDLLQGYSNDSIVEKLIALDTVTKSSVGQVLKDKNQEEFVVSFSGGVDSSILADLAKNVSQEKEIVLLSAGMVSSQDMLSLSKHRDRRKEVLVLSPIGVPTIATAAKRLAVSLRDKKIRVAHFEDCLAFLLIGEEMRRLKPSAKFIVTGNGPDELFCGYDRYRHLIDQFGEDAVEQEISRALVEAVALKSLVKEILQPLGLSTLDPFLTKDLINYSRSLPVDTKIAKGDDRLRKRIWRAYARYLGLDENIVRKPKKAMQYSMGLHGVVEKMIRNHELIIDVASQSAKI